MGMLVLTRKVNQKIKIGNNITVTVIKIQGEQVSIGLEANREVAIYREEIWEEIKNANINGAMSDKDVSLKNIKNMLNLTKGGCDEFNRQNSKCIKRKIDTATKS